MSEISVKALDERSRRRFENARVAVERGNYEYAVEICSTLLLAEPGCLEARKLLRKAQHFVFANRKGKLKRLQAYLEAGALVVYGKPYVTKRPSKAMEYGERALGYNPYNTRALSLVAAGAERLHLYRTAVFCLENAYERDSRDLALMKRYCEALIKTGETSVALTVAERLRRLKPESSSIQELVKSASVAHSIHQGKWAEEERDFRSKLKDGESDERRDQGEHFTTDDRVMELQARDLMDAIQRDPQDLELYKQLVRTLVAKEQFRNALDWLDKAASLPQAESDYALRQMKSDIAIKATEHELEKLELASERGSKDAQKRIGILKTELEYLKLENARKMVEQFPNDYGQRLLLGELMLNAGRVDEAIQQFQVSQRSSNLKARSHVLLGRSFMEKKLYDLALEQLDLAMEGAAAMDTFKKDVLYLSAKCCEKLGKEEEATRRYKRIYASDISFRDVASKIDASYRKKPG